MLGAQGNEQAGWLQEVSRSTVMIHENDEDVVYMWFFITGG